MKARAYSTARYGFERGIMNAATGREGLDSRRTVRRLTASSPIEDGISPPDDTVTLSSFFSNF
jgi:hypothetical protein